MSNRPTTPRSMKKLFALRLLLLLVALGCASSSYPPDSSARPGSDLPETFVVRDGDGTRAARSGEACRNPMIDPRDGTRLELVRSVEGRGDYEPPPGAYGTPPTGLIRIDCSTGQPIGIVER